MYIFSLLVLLDYPLEILVTVLWVSDLFVLLHYYALINRISIILTSIQLFKSPHCSDK